MIKIKHQQAFASIVNRALAQLEGVQHLPTPELVIEIKRLLSQELRRQIGNEEPRAFDFVTKWGDTKNRSLTCSCGGVVWLYPGIHVHCQVCGDPHGEDGKSSEGPKI